mgnify:CR=1 FL=1
MNKFVFIFIGLITFITTSFAQINNDDILFNVNEDVVKANEFIRVYSKNLDLVKDESQKEIDNIEKGLRNNHINRLNKGICYPESGVIFLDIISNLERVGDHANNISLMVIDELSKS